MSPINSILATIEFEFSRVLTFRRLSVALVMVLFPPLMILILSSTGGFVFAEMAMCVLCGMICLLSLLLWATPNVYSELEGKSWTFVTTRPHGRLSILFGKYLIAASWSFLVSWIGLTLCMLVVDSDQFMVLADSNHELLGEFDEIATRPIPAVESSAADPPVPEVSDEVSDEASASDSESGDASTEAWGLSRIQLWIYMSLLLALASMVYAAIFSFFGVIVQRRAMVVAVGYFIIVELMLFFVPAVIGKLAMTYHMFCLLIHWVGWIAPQDPDIGLAEFEALKGVYPAWMHLLAIFTMTAVMLTLSTFVIRGREYFTLEDAQI